MQSIILSAVLFMGTLVFYAPSLGFQFTIDDPVVTTEDPEMLTFRGNCLPFFSEGLYANTRVGGTNNSVYRPVLKCSLAYDYLLAGKQFDPRPFHRTNLFLYALCVAMVFALFGVLFAQAGETNLTLALWATLLFAVFPSHLESVCNVKTRDELFAVLFGVTAWFVALRWQRSDQRHPVPAIVAAGLFLLALLSKESALLFFPCMILWEYRCGRLHLKSPYKIPQHLLSIPVAILAYFYLRSYALGSLLAPPGTRTFFPPELNPVTRVLIACATFVRYYLWDQLLALHLNPSFSSLFLIMPGHRPAISDILAGIGIALVLMLSSWMLIRHRSHWAFWILFVLLTALLTFQIIPIGTGGAFRLVFTSSIGFCALIALAIRWLSRRLTSELEPIQQQAQVFTWAIIGAVVIFYGSISMHRMNIWQDDVRLFTYAATVQPTDPMNASKAALLNGRAGNAYAKNRFLSQSLKQFLVFQDQPQLFDERAVETFAVVATESGFSEIEHNPGRAIELAELAMKQFDRLTAIRHGTADTNTTAPYYVKALALQRLGKLDESAATCRAGLAIAYHRGLAQLLQTLKH